MMFSLLQLAMYLQTCVLDQILHVRLLISESELSQSHIQIQIK